MWVRRAAIRPIPTFAQIPEHVLHHFEDLLVENYPDTREFVDQSFSKLEGNQPALFEYVMKILNRDLDQFALALGYFLSLATWFSFDHLFGDTLCAITPMELAGVRESLQLDEQLRLADPLESLDTDDVIAIEQPHLLHFIQEHLSALMENSTDEMDLDHVHEIYQMILTEVLALSYAIKPPAHLNIEQYEHMA